VERDHFLKLFDYHHWAADRLFDAIAGVSADQLDRQWGGSFGTGRALLQHVVGADRLWVERWNGISLKEIPKFSPKHSGRDFRAEWDTVKADQRRFLDELTRDLLTNELTYVNLKGERWTYPFAEILQHVVNHGTYHRGQITHLLRDLGVAPPPTDYLVFVADRRKGG
jgi:uncharacterized damage-inducible protein DinB